MSIILCKENFNYFFGGSMSQQFESSDNKLKVPHKQSGISANMTRKMSKRGFTGKKKKQYPSNVSETLNFIFDKKDRKEFKKQTEDIIRSAQDLTNIAYSLRSIIVMCSLTLPEPIDNNFIQTEDSKKWKELIKFGEQLKPILEKCNAINEALEEVKIQIRIDKALKIIMSKVIDPLSYIQDNLSQAVVVCNNFVPKYIDDIKALGTEESATVCTYIETVLPYLINGTSVKTDFTPLSSENNIEDEVLAEVFPEIQKEEELTDDLSRKETTEK